jgi:hypothetical protein
VGRRGRVRGRSCEGWKEEGEERLYIKTIYRLDLGEK